MQQIQFQQECMGVEEVEYLAKEYPNTKIYAIHRSDYIHNHIKNNRISRRRRYYKFIRIKNKFTSYF